WEQVPRQRLQVLHGVSVAARPLSGAATAGVLTPSWAAPRLGGLAVLEACCFVGAAGGVAGAVRMSAGARECAAIDDQVFLADRTTIKPALEDLAHSGRIAGLRGERRPRHVWRHPVVGHRPPRMIPGGG